MKYSALFGLGSLMVMQVLAVAIPEPDPKSGAGLEEYLKRRNLELIVPELEAQAFPGGETIKVNGTVEQLRAKLLSLNPNYDKDFPLPEVTTSPSDTGVSPNPNHAKRSIFKYYNVWCNGPFDLAATKPLTEGIDYLRGLKGRPSLEKGCSRVSCSWDAAIYWCNLSGSLKVLEGWNSIADGAAAIKNKCNNEPNYWPRFSGGALHETNWEVLMGKDDC